MIESFTVFSDVRAVCIASDSEDDALRRSHSSGNLHIFKLHCVQRTATQDLFVFVLCTFK